MPDQIAYRRPTAISAIDTSYLVQREPGVAPPEVEAYAAEIHESLERGDVEDAYSCLRDWLAREARYAGAGRSANLTEVLRVVLEMLSWSVERVPRSLARVQPVAVAA